MNDIKAWSYLIDYRYLPQAEVDGRYTHYQQLKEDGTSMLNSNHYASEDIRSTLSQLDEQWRTLNETWEDRKQMLTQCYDLQVKNARKAKKSHLMPFLDYGNLLFEEQLQIGQNIETLIIDIKINTAI